jgi:hypothetical protein
LTVVPSVAGPDLRERLPRGGVALINVNKLLLLKLQETELGGGMMIDGTYGFVFAGALGIGIGVFRVTNGQLIGSDSSGCDYRGTVTEDASDHRLSIKLDQFAPNHVRAAYSRRFSREKTIRSALDFSIGPNFEDGRPFPLETSTDVVTVIIRRISDKYDKYVNGLKIVRSS